MSSKRPRNDWIAIRTTWIDMPVRSFVQVAKLFGVSDTAVRNHARAEGWEELAARVDAEASEKALRRNVKTREQRTSAVLALTDRLIDHVAGDAFASKAEAATFLDVERMTKLSELLLGEATDRVETSEAQDAIRRLLEHAIATVLLVAAELLGEKKAREFARAYQAQFLASVKDVLAIGPGEPE